MQEARQIAERRSGERGLAARQVRVDGRRSTRATRSRSTTSCIFTHTLWHSLSPQALVAAEAELAEAQQALDAPVPPEELHRALEAAQVGRGGQERVGAGG